MTTVNANIAAPRLLLVAGGAVKQIAEVLGKFGLSRPLIVSDPFMVKLGLIERCLAPLAAAGIKADVFSDTIPEPTDTVIEAGVAAFAKRTYDCLIGFGGGSPIDTAKAIAMLAAGGGKMRDYKVPSPPTEARCRSSPSPPPPAPAASARASPSSPTPSATRRC